jgi:hypothetical protein
MSKFFPAVGNPTMESTAMRATAFDELERPLSLLVTDRRIETIP